METSGYLDILPKVQALHSGRAVLLLGTDHHIGEAVNQPEQRVGIVPIQAHALTSWLRELGITLDFHFIQGAGINAGYPDGAYVSVGGVLTYE